MSWGEAFGHAVGMYATLFAVGIVFAIPAAIGYTLATDGNMAGIALILASALAYHVCSLAIVVKGVSDAARGGNVAIRRNEESHRIVAPRRRRGILPLHAGGQRLRSVARRRGPAQESNHVEDWTVAVGVEFHPTASVKINFDPVPPLRFSVSRNERVELAIDCHESVSWTVSQIGGNIRLAIESGSGVGSGIAKLRCAPTEIYTLRRPRIAVVRIEFDNGDKIGRTVDCEVAP